MCLGQKDCLSCSHCCRSSLPAPALGTGRRQLAPSLKGGTPGCQRAQHIPSAVFLLAQGPDGTDLTGVYLPYVGTGSLFFFFFGCCYCEQFKFYFPSLLYKCSTCTYTLTHVCVSTNECVYTCQHMPINYYIHF